MTALGAGLSSGQVPGRFYGVPCTNSQSATGSADALQPPGRVLLPEQLPHRGGQRDHERPARQWNPAPADLLGALEMQVTLGTAGRVSDNVQVALLGLRRLVRTWAGPHLYPGGPTEVCPGCGGTNVNRDCPYRSLILDVVAEVSKGFAPARDEGG